MLAAAWACTDYTAHGCCEGLVGVAYGRVGVRNQRSAIVDGGGCKEMLDRKYLDILHTIAQRLSGRAIDWAVTGSCGFALQGLKVDVHDIDLQTSRDGAYAIERAFADKSTRKVCFRESERIRSHFGALEIDGVTIEIMGDLQKRLDGVVWEPPVDVRLYTRHVTIGDRDIPVLSLEYEYRAYLALGRLEQAEMLRSWLQEHADSRSGFPRTGWGRG